MQVMMQELAHARKFVVESFDRLIPLCLCTNF
jgi:hypothetical protein